MGTPLVLAVDLPNGEVLAQEVDETSTTESLLEVLLQAPPFLKEPETETLWLFRRQSDSMTPSERHARASDGAALQEFDYPLPREKKILKLLYQAEKESESHHGPGGPPRQAATSLRRTGSSSKSSFARDPLQKMNFIVKRRIFPSLFVYKAFKKLPKQSLEQAFHQIRADYVEKNLLKDVCAAEDVVYFGALILKVKL